MAETTGIAWVDSTWNPWIGCTEVSAACDFCYARTMSERYGWAQWGDHPRHRTAASTWRKPLAWNREAGTNWQAQKCVSIAMRSIRQSGPRAMASGPMVTHRRDAAP